MAALRDTPGYPKRMIVLCEDEDTDGNVDSIPCPGGKFTYHASGTFGGSDSVKIQYSGNNGASFKDITGASWSAAAVGEIAIGVGLIRAVASISGTSSITLTLGPYVNN